MPHWPAPDWAVDFDAPYFLLLLAVLPVFWLIGRQSLRALGNWRRQAAIGARVLVATLIIAALAEPNWLTLINRLTVLFLVDGSASIQREELVQAIDYVNAAVGQRDVERGDRAGLIMFGREAKTEVPPNDGPWQVAQVETPIDPRFTNLESALKLAEATFPADTARRVVVVSDGNENTGRATPQARKMAAEGIGIDVVPIHYERRGDVAVEKIAVPADVRRATPFELRVVLNNLAAERAIPGKLRITRELGGVQHLVVEEAITVKPGKQVLNLAQELEESGLTTYDAVFLPDDAADDVHGENNSATAFARVGGRGHVLVIEDASQPGRFQPLVDLLRRNEIEVTIRDTRRPFDNLADLQLFDSVILADVPRVSGEDANEITQFSDPQIRDLVHNTEHFGSGLVVLGGANSYGAGGWRNTELEKALPVRFQIDDAKVEAVGALVLVIDSSGSMTGDKIRWSKAAAAAASEMLGSRDFIGVVTFDSEAHWVVRVQRNGSQGRTRSQISRIAASGGTDLMPALREAYRAIQGAEASLKHVLVLTDGQTPQNSYAALAAQMRQRGITTSGVAIGGDADRVLLSQISSGGGGKFYHVLSPRAIPRIFMREARRVSRPLVFEDPNGIASQIVTTSEVLSGITSPPPVKGYVLTTVKEDPLVEVLLATPRQPAPNGAILAAWQFGLGRSVALTTDVGERWATAWPEWGGYEKMMLQMVRWSMRPHDGNNQLAMTTEVRDGAVHVVVNALDQQDQHLNLLQMSGMAVTPGGESSNFQLEQTAPGRYVAKLPAEEPGNYYLSISPGGNTAPLRTAISVSNSAELERLASNDSFMIRLAEEQPKDGKAGVVITSPRGLADKERLLTTNVFRPGLAAAKSRDSMWPLALLAATVVFLSDVFVRRVMINFGWVPALVAPLPFARRPIAEAASPRMERLKQSKASVAQRIDAAQSAARFEMAGDTPQQEFAAAEQARPIERGPAPPSTEQLVDPTESHAIGRDAPTDFTARLLEAKNRVRSERKPRQ